jgi:DNA-binding MarR family transcriptional regulator
LNWLYVAIAAVGGGLAGWAANALVRRGVQRRSSPDTSRSPIVVESPLAPDSSSPTNRTAVASPPVTRRTISKDADTAGRVIAHISSLGRLGNDEIASLGFTQIGMGEKLGIRQGTLAKVLSRLEAAKVVEVDRRHVQSRPRRLKVYRLTSLGESVARDLRRRGPP